MFLKFIVLLEGWNQQLLANWPHSITHPKGIKIVNTLTASKPDLAGSRVIDCVADHTATRRVQMKRLFHIKRTEKKYNKINLDMETFQSSPCYTY